MVPDTRVVYISIMSCLDVSTAGGLCRDRGNMRKAYAEQSAAGETALMA